MGIPVSRIIQAALVGTGVLYAIRWLGRKMETSKAAEIPSNGKTRPDGLDQQRPDAG